MLKGPLPEQVDHKKLAVEKARLNGTIRIAHFPRLRDLVTHHDGELSVRLQFQKGKKQKSFVVGACEGTVEMVCQSCLEPVTVGINARIRTLLLDADEELMALPKEQDGLVCLTEEITMVDLLEDDIIVSLPMVARHDEGQCGTIERALEPEPEDQEDQEDQEETYRPFADLKKALKKQ